MRNRQTESRFQVSHAPITRRAALRGAAVMGGLTLLTTRGTDRSLAQEGTPSATTAVEDYPEVEITAADFSFELPASIPAGLTRLTLKNDSVIDHHAMFMRLNDDAELADLEAALTQPDLGPIFAVSQSLGGPDVGAGLQATVIADLPAGQYMVICVIPEADGIPHYMMGMQAPLEVTEATEALAAPVADATVELVDFAFEMPAMKIAAGPQIWAAPNVGEQVHEMVIMRQAPGVTFAQVQEMLSAPPATPAAGAEASPMAAMSGPPPFALIGGVAPMSPGFTNWAVLDLEAGDYFAICFVPDPASGAPHFALGMLMPFTVA